MNLSVDDAKTVATFISAIVIPFAVIWLQKLEWSAQAKFALAVVLSLVAGALTAYIADQTVFSGSLINTASVIFTAAQVVYYGAFRALGLEKVLFPQEALVNAAKEQVTQEVKDVSKEQAQAILDVNAPPKLEVSASVVNAPGDVQ